MSRTCKNGRIARTKESLAANFGRRRRAVRTPRERWEDAVRMDAKNLLTIIINTQIQNLKKIKQ